MNGARRETSAEAEERRARDSVPQGAGPTLSAWVPRAVVEGPGL